MKVWALYFERCCECIPEHLMKYNDHSLSGDMGVRMKPGRRDHLQWTQDTRCRQAPRADHISHLPLLGLGAASSSDPTILPRGINSLSRGERLQYSQDRICSRTSRNRGAEPWSTIFFDTNFFSSSASGTLLGWGSCNI